MMQFDVENREVSEETEVDDSELDAKHTLLDEYLSIFIENSKKAKEIDSSRVLFYRGQANKSYKLEPSVFRKDCLKSEDKMIRELLAAAADNFANTVNPFERLVKMQHYGLPTRLLDVTTNPLIALYFACVDCPENDGEIIVFYDFRVFHNDAKVRALATLAEYHGKNENAMRTFLDEQGFNLARINTNELLKTPFIIVEPPMNNERIKRQSGAFVLVGIRLDNQVYEKEAFDLRDLVVIKGNEGIERSIIIPKNNKSQLLDELDVIGINKAFVYPELEHQAAYIKSVYEVI